MFSYFTHIVTNFISQSAYISVLVLMTLESFNFPIPSEVVMPFAGFLASRGEVNFYVVVALGALGNLLGSLLSYFLAEWILFLREKHLILKKFLPDKHLKKATAWFEKYGAFSIFWSRIVPVVRTFISLPAGLFKMRLSVFIPLTFLGSLMWSLFLTYIGFVLKENWQVLEDLFRKFDYFVIGILVILFLSFLLYFLFRKKKLLSFK